MNYSYDDARQWDDDFEVNTLLFLINIQLDFFL